MCSHSSSPLAFLYPSPSSNNKSQRLELLQMWKEAANDWPAQHHTTTLFRKAPTRNPPAQEVHCEEHGYALQPNPNTNLPSPPKSHAPIGRPKPPDPTPLARKKAPSHGPRVHNPSPRPHPKTKYQCADTTVAAVVPAVTDSQCSNPHLLQMA